MERAATSTQAKERWTFGICKGLAEGEGASLQEGGDGQSCKDPRPTKPPNTGVWVLDRPHKQDACHLALSCEAAGLNLNVLGSVSPVGKLLPQP
jgi:hypothetical protein